MVSCSVSFFSQIVVDTILGVNMIYSLKGPTLLKANEDSLAAVLEIKFNNLVIEILIENYELIFKSPPGKTSEYVWVVLRQLDLSC